MVATDHIAAATQPGCTRVQPHLTGLHCSLGPSESASKRHLDPFIRFRRSYRCAQQATPTAQTDRSAPSVVIDRLYATAA